MFQKGQKYQIKITDMSDQGQGIGRTDGMAVFAAGAVPGDQVTVELTKVKKNYAFSRLIRIDEPSPQRIEAPCPCVEQGCGGCSMSSLSYEGQLELKQKQVYEKLVRLGGLEHPRVNPILGMTGESAPFFYRNKAQFPVSTGGIITRKGGVIENLGTPAVGFYKARSHEVVNCESCMLQSPAAMAAAAALRRFMEEDHITAWDEKWEKGLLRHLIVKTAFGTGEVMVILVINGKGIPNGQKLVEMLDEAVYEAGYSLESVVLNLNKKKTAEIMGEECITLAGKPTILEQVGGLAFEISPRSFYQVNPVQMERLYEKALEYAGLTGAETVLDLYCGVGTIGLFCASSAAQVVGIESVKNAVIDANRNAVINGIVNARFLCGKAEEILPPLVEAGESAEMQPDDGDRAGGNAAEVQEIDPQVAGYVREAKVAIVDPPRAGCRPELLEAISRTPVERIVYISCDPATMARDVKALGQLGYRFEEATPVDMFPWTGSVEVVCLLSKLHAKQTIEVELEMSEMDLMDAESKATYE